MPFGLHWHAGNLLFVGDLGHNFRALDQENGKVLWDIRIDISIAHFLRG
ncbi:MAG TPA: hypothetical protein VGQ49_14085 [Bryobacteraceae bacterium]|nr:hypothetical protein [Bryobacteraceae bacterium]